MTAPRRRWPAPLLAVLLGLAAGSGHGAYVTDQLVARLYKAPKSDAETLDLLRSGTPLEVLERDGDFAQVRLEDKRTGWVKVGYIADGKPAALLLDEAQARVAELEQQLAAGASEPAECPEPEETASQEAAPEPPEPAPAATESTAASTDPAPPATAPDTDAPGTEADAARAEPADCAVSETDLIAAREELLEIAGRLGHEPDSSAVAVVQVTSLRNDEDWWPVVRPWLPLATALAGIVVGALVSWRLVNRRVRERFGGIQF